MTSHQLKDTNICDKNGYDWWPMTVLMIVSGVFGGLFFGSVGCRVVSEIFGRKGDDMFLCFLLLIRARVCQLKL